MNAINCDQAPVRQVRRIKPTRRSVSGVYMFRDQTAIPFESTLERDFLVRMEFIPNVLDIIAQPVSIPFKDSQGRNAKYTPDYLVYYQLGDHHFNNYPRPMLVEVKPAAEWRANWRKWSSKWKRARQHAFNQGWEFRIYDESRIRDQTFENIKFLERFQRMSFPEQESSWILDNLREMGSAPFHYLLARHFMGKYRAEGVAHLWHLLSTRRLDCDMTEPLNDQTQFWVNNHE